MTWQRPARSPDAVAIYVAAEADRRDHPERYRLDADTVIARAGDTNSGRGVDLERCATGWRDGLDAYLSSAAQDGCLNALGSKMVQHTAVGRLRAGVRIADTHAARRPVSLPSPPIVIIGGWRTGTTFLFRLLGSDERLHAPLPAELTAPWRFAGLERPARVEAIEKAAGAHRLLHVLNPTMAAVHDSGPWLPEECVLAMGADLRNWGFTSTVRLDAYATWLAEQDLGPSYLRYRQVLELLADGDRRRFVLKAPAHTAELDHLVAAFPGAVVVHLHRDVVETVASASSLFAVFRSTYSDDVDLLDVGRYQAEQTERWFRRAAAFRASPAASGATFVDVEYRDLVADPASTLAAIYAAADIEAPANLARFVDEYRRAFPRRAHGGHDYSPADFGLDPDALRERFADLDA